MKILRLKYAGCKMTKKKKEWMTKNSKQMYYIKIGILNKLFEVDGTCCKHM